MPYNQEITASGGVGAVTLELSNLSPAAGIPGLVPPQSGTGSLPIIGTPTASGTETFTITAFDSEVPPASVTANYTITVNPAVTLSPATPLPATTVLPADIVDAPTARRLRPVGALAGDAGG